jgi:hypothetical protein
MRIEERRSLLICSVSLLVAHAQARAGVSAWRVGVFSLLGNSVRVVARELQEVMFKDVGMDDIVLRTAENVLHAQLPQTQVILQRAAEQVNINDQLEIGTQAGRRGELPDWITQVATTERLTHVLLITSNIGAMEFRTGMTQVVGNNRVTGIGFYVGADGRTTNSRTGAVSSGYLAPFVQLRLSLIDVSQRSVVASTSLSDGFIVGPPEVEASDPWKFMSRAEKTRALQQLLASNVQRGVEDLIKGR